MKFHVRSFCGDYTVGMSSMTGERRGVVVENVKKWLSLSLSQKVGFQYLVVCINVCVCK